METKCTGTCTQFDVMSVDGAQAIVLSIVVSVSEAVKAESSTEPQVAKSVEVTVTFVSR